MMLECDHTRLVVGPVIERPSVTPSAELEHGSNAGKSKILRDERETANADLIPRLHAADPDTRIAHCRARPGRYGQRAEGSA